MELNSSVTRIDIEQQGDSILVLEFKDGWKPGNPPDNVYRINDEPFSEALIFLIRLSGWTVVEWTIGARAWKDGIKPVRTGSQIRRKREQVRKSADWYRKQGVDLTLNLAFYM